MKRSKVTGQQIFATLKKAEAGATVKDVGRRYGLSPATFYQWKSEHGGLEASDMNRMKEHEQKNARLKQLYAESTLENIAIPSFSGIPLSIAAMRSGIGLYTLES